MEYLVDWKTLIDISSIKVVQSANAAQRKLQDFGSVKPLDQILDLSSSKAKKNRGGLKIGFPKNFFLNHLVETILQRSK